MCLLNSSCFYLIIFLMSSVILCSSGGNAYPVSEIRMKQLVSRPADPRDNEKTPRGSGNVENNNNNESSPRQLIEAVEFQIIRELQKMINFSLEGSDEASGALSEIRACMENGMQFTDALREGLKKMFPDIIGQESTSHDGAMLTIILFTNAKKYMQDVYILNLLQQQIKEYEYRANESFNSSTNENLRKAGDRQSSQYSRSSKLATKEDTSENVTSEYVNTETSEINSSASRKNNSSQSGTPQLARGVPKIKFDREQTDTASVSDTLQTYNDLTENEFSQQQVKGSSRPIISRPSNDAPTSQQKVQNDFSDSSRFIRSSNVDAAKKQGSQQRKFSQNISGENTARKYSSEPSRQPQVIRERTVQIMEDSSIRSDLAGLSDAVNKLKSNVRGSQQRYQEIKDDNSSLSIALEKKAASDCDTKRKQNFPLVGNDEEVQTKKPHFKNTLEIPIQNQQLQNSSRSTLETPARDFKKMTEKSQFSSEKIAKGNIAVPSKAINQRILNIQDSEEQYETVNGNSLSIESTREEKQDDLDVIQPLRMPTDGIVDVEKSTSQRTLKMSNQDQKLKNSNSFSGRPSTQNMRKVTEESQFVGDEVTEENFITQDHQNKKISQIEPVETKPSLKESSTIMKTMEPKRVVQSSGTNSSSETTGTSRNSMSRRTENSASSGHLGPQTPQLSAKKSEVPERKPKQLILQDEINTNQNQNLKRSVLNSKEINQPSGVENLFAGDIDGKKLSSQRRMNSQMEKVEHEDFVEVENVHLGETQPAGSVKKQTLRSETPSVRTRTVISRESEPAREELQNKYKEYRGEKEYSGRSNTYGSRTDNLGQRGYEESRGKGKYEETKESYEYEINEGYEGNGENIIQGQQWNGNASVDRAREKLYGGSALQSESNRSQFQLVEKLKATRPYSKTAEKSVMELSDAKGAIIKTRTEQRSSTNNGQNTDTLMESRYQPENQKWKRRVVKIVEKTDPSGKITRKISKSGDWSTVTEPINLEDSVVWPKKSIDDPSFFQQNTSTVRRSNWSRSGFVSYS